MRDELHEANTRELNALQWHVVKRGETLATIARKLRVNRTDLVEANYLRAASKVTSGQRLLIPRMPSAALLARGGTAIPAGAVADDTTADTQSEDTARRVHRVKAGETLYSIARKYQTTVESVKSVNNLRRSALKVGTRLTIQTGRSVATQQQ